VKKEKMERKKMKIMAMVFVAAMAIAVFATAVVGTTAVTIANGDLNHGNDLKVLQKESPKDLEWKTSMSAWNKTRYTPLFDKRIKGVRSIVPRDIEIIGDAVQLWSKSTSGLEYGYPVDDLNGDGVIDVIAEIEDAGDCKIMALKGADGSKEWETYLGSVTDGYFYSMPTDDLNGDGLKDIIAQVYEYTAEATEIIAVQGTNGAVLWRMVVEGDAWCYPVEDLSGDGLADIVLEVHDWSTDTSQIIALRGSDGHELWSKSFDGNAWSYEAGDLTGDGLTDVVLDVFYTDTQQVIALRGNDGYELWRKSATGWIYSIPAADLNGDEMDDVVVSTVSLDWDYAEVRAVKGNDGSTLWVKSVSGENVWMASQFTDDFNGDGIIDVLAYTQTYDTGIYSYQATAVRGNDGYEQWVTDLGSDDWEYWPWAFFDEDITGNEIKDILVNAYDLIAIRGTDGYKVWSSTFDVDWRWAYPAGDLTGDGLTDVLVEGEGEEEEELGSTYISKIIAVKGTDGHVLWSKSSSDWMWSCPAGDLTGDGADDVIVEYDEEVSAVKGTDGDELWSAKSEDYVWVGRTHFVTPEEVSCGADLNSDGVNDVLIGTYGSMYALTVVPIPSVSISTDEFEYTPGDTMTVTIDIANPTEDSVTFQWYWMVPQFSVCVPVMSSSIPAGYDDTLDFSFTIPDWGSTPFGNVFYVQLLDASGEVLDADAACWAYSPGGVVMPAAGVNIGEEIKKTIKILE
jgi:hypothetical protein